MERQSQETHAYPHGRAPQQLKYGWLWATKSDAHKTGAYRTPKMPTVVNALKTSNKRLIILTVALFWVAAITPLEK